MSRKALPPLHLACSDEEQTRAISHVEIVDGIATATNGHILARLNLREYSTLPEVAIKALSGQLIHRDIWESIMDADLIEVNGDSLHYEKGGIKADYDISTDFTFPNYGPIVAAVANSKFDKKSFVSFAPKFIQIAAKLFPSENLICRFYESADMMILFPSGEAKGFLGVMPIKIKDDEAVIDFTLS